MGKDRVKSVESMHGLNSDQFFFPQFYTQLQRSANLHTEFQAILVSDFSVGMTELIIIFIGIIANNTLYIYQIQAKLGTEICLCMLFMCAKFQGNQAWIDYFMTIFKKCAK